MKYPIVILTLFGLAPLVPSAAPFADTDLAAHDREVLAIVTSLEQDPACQPVSDHLNTMIIRLNGSVASNNPASPHAN